MMTQAAKRDFDVGDYEENYEVRLSQLSFVFTEEACVHVPLLGVQDRLFQSVADCRH
jgi:hypothetical protein